MKSSSLKKAFAACLALFSLSVSFNPSCTQETTIINNLTAATDRDNTANVRLVSDTSESANAPVL